MNKQTEALKMAVEAMSCISQSRGDPLLKAIRACKEALEPDRTGMVYYKNNACKAKDANSPDCICWTPEQPAQEPVAWLAMRDGKVINAYPYRPNDHDGYWKAKGFSYIPLYTKEQL